MIVSFPIVAVSVITLQCDSLQQLCPNDDQPRMCVCNSTGNVLVWSTSVTGTVAAFLSSASAGTNETEGGFTAVLTERANGVSVSTLTFNPSNVRATGTLGVEVTCEGSSVMTDNIAVTSAGNVVYRLASITMPCTPVLQLFLVFVSSEHTVYHVTLPITHTRSLYSGMIMIQEVLMSVYCTIWWR